MIFLVFVVVVLLLLFFCLFVCCCFFQKTGLGISYNCLQPENWICHFMQIVSIGGISYEMSNPVFWEK